MIVFVLSFFTFALAIAGLGIGAILGRGPLRGSCGGDTVISVCPICTEGDEQ